MQAVHKHTHDEGFMVNWSSQPVKILLGFPQRQFVIVNFIDVFLMGRTNVSNGIDVFRVFSVL